MSEEDDGEEEEFEPLKLDEDVWNGFGGLSVGLLPEQGYVAIRFKSEGGQSLTTMFGSDQAREIAKHLLESAKELDENKEGMNGKRKN